jgi:hypothetical protein
MNGKGIQENAIHETIPLPFLMGRGNGLFHPAATAAIVVVATKRWPMLSTMTPKPSNVLSPSRVISPDSAKTSSSFVPENDSNYYYRVGVI